MGSRTKCRSCCVLACVYATPTFMRWIATSIGTKIASVAAGRSLRSNGAAFAATLGVHALVLLLFLSPGRVTPPEPAVPVVLIPISPPAQPLEDIILQEDRVMEAVVPLDTLVLPDIRLPELPSAITLPDDNRRVLDALGEYLSCNLANYENLWGAERLRCAQRLGEVPWDPNSSMPLTVREQVLWTYWAALMEERRSAPVEPFLDCPLGSQQERMGIPCLNEDARPSMLLTTSPL